MANWREPIKPSGGRRFQAMGLAMILVFVGFWYFWDARLSRTKGPDSQIVDVSPDALAEMLGEGKPVVLEFYTNACPWCVKMEPELARVNQTYGKEIVVAKMNAEKYYVEAGKYRITGVPALVLFDAEGSAVAIASGYREFDEIAEILKDYEFVK
jgi:thioredoxin-like negative regulator of GroEL